MTKTLKQAGMIVVLMLLSEGLFVFYSGVGPGNASRTKATATVELFAGFPVRVGIDAVVQTRDNR